MSELIKLADRQIGTGTIQTVNARDLHSFLEVRKDFSTWIKDRIHQYGFVHGHDFVIAHELSSPKLGRSMARPQQTVAYYLTLDTAKEIAMVERNERGKQARQYFIECEHRAKAGIVDVTVALNDPETLRKLLLTNVERVLALQTQLQEQAPKVEALELIATADGLLNITMTAKALQVRPRALFVYMQHHGWIFRSARSGGFLGYQSKVTAGLLEHKVTTFGRADGSRKVMEQVLVTARGLAKLAEILPSADIATTRSLAPTNNLELRAP